MTTLIYLIIDYQSFLLPIYHDQCYYHYKRLETVEYSTLASVI